MLKRFSQNKNFIILLLAFSSFYTTSISALEKRIALVIGNNDYKNMPPLKNPVNDATDISSKLISFGFQVDTLLNVNYKQMKQAISHFGKNIKQKNTVGLFFFAGHGLQVNNYNYLVPLGADISDESDVQFEAINANRVLSKMSLAGNGLNLMILDACRNNPLSRGFRSASRGLSLMRPLSGSLVLYATEPGSVAADGTGKNGLFTEKLLDAMDEDGLKIEEIFKQTAIKVSNASGKKQIPWAEGVILGDFYFKKNKSHSPNLSTNNIAKKKITTRSDSQLKTTENLFWSSLGKKPNIGDYSAYLNAYPEGHFSALAKSKLRQLSNINPTYKITQVENVSTNVIPSNEILKPKKKISENWKERKGINEGYRKVSINEGQIKLIYSGDGNELAQITVYKEIAIEQLEGYIFKSNFYISDRDNNGYQGLKLSFFNSQKKPIADFAWSGDKYFTLLAKGKVFQIESNINHQIEFSPYLFLKGKLKAEVINRIKYAIISFNIQPPIGYHCRRCTIDASNIYFFKE